MLAAWNSATLMHLLEGAGYTLTVTDSGKKLAASRRIDEHMITIQSVGAFFNYIVNNAMLETTLVELFDKMGDLRRPECNVIGQIEMHWEDPKS